MYLVVMISNSRSYCIAERSFSNMKLIRNRLRTSMCNGRLSHLVLMSIESDILLGINFEDLVIVNSKLLKRHLKAKRRAPAYSRALRQIRGVFQRIVRGRLRSVIQRV